VQYPEPLANGKLPYTVPNDAISPLHLAPKLPLWNCRRYRWTLCTMHGFLTHPPPWENNPAQALGGLNTPHSKTESHKHRTVIKHWHGGCETMNPPWRMGDGQWAYLSLLNSQRYEKKLSSQWQALTDKPYNSKGIDPMNVVMLNYISRQGSHTHQHKN
jgi:hypothetical protein